MSYLTKHEAAKSWVLRECGWKKRDIQARFNVDPRRLYDVWEEKTHLGSRQRAIEIFIRMFPDKYFDGRFQLHSPKYERKLKHHDTPNLPGII